MDKKNIKKEYTNGEITVVWQPGMCIHSKKCWHGLPEVFNPEGRPWINLDVSNSESIMQQIDQCPSGALSYYKNGELPSTSTSDKQKVDVMPNGPLLVHGHLEVQHSNGETEEKQKVTAFCRCGASVNKPYCDGSHSKIGFEG